ncbi:efflux transporter outer membrane subunit [Allorhizobium taibaishanense]|uniref:Multidrug efflux system outer membrane protein n=1 Tax=Allorhizobium taibaishanense TaxID=887144 RepID=A0A1Q9ABL3_9HYPH|nr:efflux transporter outer membrane subunit [Allorhizobium taibaishanense]MBB4010667.1 multidrug efflux system outer membrane protein [Allorhizobium taibaishanense]OLP52241.1 nodulation protein NodT [Allorhizobium taibaishanense]
MVSVRLAAPLAMLFLSGCVFGPEHSPPQTALPAKFNEGGTKSDQDVTSVQWWTAFNDTRLNKLINMGINQNLDILQALERIEQARASVVTSAAGGLPSLTGTASETGSQTNGGFNSQPRSWDSKGELSASWLLDLWGEYRRAKQSAKASLDSAFASVDTARLTYLSDLATAYIDARYYQARIAIANEAVRSRRETLSLTKLQLEAGAASRLDVVQSEGLVNSTLADIPGFEASFYSNAYHISTLLGMPASTLINDLKKSAPQPVARHKVISGIPADLIRNRPDIRAAERNLASAVYDIGNAQAKLLPSITLSGSISPSYVHSSSHGTSNTWSFGPSLNLPIFDGGTLRANVKNAQSVAREKYLLWKQTVLNGVEDVESALAAYNRDARAVAANRAYVKSYKEALELSTASYKDGASSLLDVLDAQRSLTDAQASLATSIQQMANDYVTLNVAIGGGYNFNGTAQQVEAKVKPADIPPSLAKK